MDMQYQVYDGKEKIKVHVKRSDRKTIGLEVKSTGEVIARIPRFLHEMEVQRFLEKYIPDYKERRKELRKIQI